jgi:hypothetical protein
MSFFGAGGSRCKQPAERERGNGSHHGAHFRFLTSLSRKIEREHPAPTAPKLK